MQEAWPEVQVDNVDSSGIPQQAQAGDTLEVRAGVRLDGLSPDDVAVELAYGRTNEDDALARDHSVYRLSPEGGAVDGVTTFTGVAAADGDRHVRLHGAGGADASAARVAGRAGARHLRLVKPFVLLATRAEDLPADEEYALFLRYTGLAPDQLIRVRLEAGPMPELDLDDLSGIFVGGGPFNASDPAEKKSAVQHRVEAEFQTLLDEVVARDFPFLGACYGIGTLGTHQGATIDRTYPEPISVVTVTLTEAAASDPLLEGMPDDVRGLRRPQGGDLASCPTAVLLASSPTCPVQMFRVGENVYATQFHPELDVDGITTRIHAYADHGYFAAARTRSHPGGRAPGAGGAPEPDPAQLREALRPPVAELLSGCQYGGTVQIIGLAGPVSALEPPTKSEWGGAERPGLRQPGRSVPGSLARSPR